jgi:hydroxymethylbilane synthase
MEKALRIGTRGSRLAMVQTEQVAARLRAADAGLEIRIETFRTVGDRDRATPLARLPGTGFFVKELEAALLDDRIDLAVHSLKDVPTAVPAGLEVGAVVPGREDPRECLLLAEGRGGSGEPQRNNQGESPRNASSGCATAGLSGRVSEMDDGARPGKTGRGTQSPAALADLPQGAVVGTSSPRRRAMLLSARPDLVFADLRGNVDTRLGKMRAGVCAATVLARAGLARLGLLDRLAGAAAVALDANVLMPPAGQGALGLEFRAADERVRRWLEPLDHPPSRWAVLAERALVRRLAAGCRTPLGVLGRVNEGGRLMLDVWLLAPDGRESLRRQACGEAAQAEALGTQLAEALLAAGAGRFLAGPCAAGADAGGCE